jgi:hypothetical protein
MTGSVTPPGPLETSDRSRAVAVVLAAILGPFGAHRFYTGRVRSGVLMAVTLGGAGIWYLYDLIVVAAGDFRDAQGRVVSRWEVDPGIRSAPPADLQDEVDVLRLEVAELAERLDFTERLLAAGRRRPEMGVDRGTGGEGPQGGSHHDQP